MYFLFMRGKRLQAVDVILVCVKKLASRVFKFRCVKIEVKTPENM